MQGARSRKKEKAATKSAPNHRLGEPKAPIPRVPRKIAMGKERKKKAGRAGRDQITISAALCLCSPVHAPLSCGMRVVAGCPTNPSPKAEHALGPQVQACMAIKQLMQQHCTPATSNWLFSCHTEREIKKYYSNPV
jgi:hypothetical protein